MPVRADGGIAAQFCRNELSDLLNIVSDNPSVTFGDSSLYTREPHVYKQNTCTFFVQVRSLTNLSLEFVDDLGSPSGRAQAIKKVPFLMGRPIA